MDFQNETWGANMIKFDIKVNVFFTISKNIVLLFKRHFLSSNLHFGSCLSSGHHFGFPLVIISSLLEPPGPPRRPSGRPKHLCLMTQDPSLQAQSSSKMTHSASQSRILSPYAIRIMHIDPKYPNMIQHGLSKRDLGRQHDQFSYKNSCIFNTCKKPCVVI